MLSVDQSLGLEKQRAKCPRRIAVAQKHNAVNQTDATAEMAWQDDRHHTPQVRCADDISAGT